MNTAMIDTLPNGEYLVSNDKTEMGPFRLRETAESAQRMLDNFSKTNEMIRETIKTMKGEPQ